MNIRIKAALYAIGFFAVIFALQLGIYAILPYLESWMGWTAVLTFMFYLVYSSVLAQLKFDESITRVTNFPKEKE